MQFKYELKNKIAFYWSYFTKKVFFLWFEVKSPKLKMFIYEMLYSSTKFVDRDSLLPSPFETDMVETKFGIFRIRPRTVDMSNCSPAYERRDVDHLLKLIEKLRKESKSILFFDIGADIGTFAVTVGNRFRNYQKLRIMAFEPSPTSYKVLTGNIILNDLAGKVKQCNFALYRADNVELSFEFNLGAPGSSGLKMASGVAGPEKVLARTLDAAVGGDAADCDTLIFKMDVEGAEKEVLQGAEKLLGSGKELYLLVEDFVNPDIIDHLETIGAEFLCKLTPYNSWWHYCKRG